MTEEFQQPVLEGNVSPVAETNGNGKGFGSKAVTISQDNSGKTDALSKAIADRRKVVAPEPAKPREPGNYQLDYVYNGEHITETHDTIPHAVARVDALKRLGIVPATSIRNAEAA